MAYINPIELLDLGETQDLSPTLIKREKKRLLAEFELNDAVEIEVGNQSLDKARLIQLFEELENEELRAFHLKIYQHQSLHRFLAEANLDLFYDQQIHALQGQTADFLQFLAPHFAKPFNQRLLNAIRQKDLDETRVLCQVPLPIPVAYQAACFQNSYRYLHEQINEIDALSQRMEEGEAPSGKIQEVCDEMLIDLLNLLPAYFDGVRDRYGLALESLALQVQNSHQRVQLSIFIIKQGLKLRTSPDTERRLQYVLDQLQKLAPLETFMETLTGGSSGKKKKGQYWWYALGVGAVIWLLAQWLF